MRGQAWLLKRLVVFVLLSIPFLIFFCYANDRNRAAISFGFTIWGATFGLFTYLSQLQTKRREKSDDFFNTYRTDAELKVGMENVHRMRETGEVSLVDSNERKSVLALLNFFELMCSAILINAADEFTLKRLMFTSLIASFRSAEPFILQMRKANSMPTIFQSFEQVAERWERHPLK